MTKHLLEAVVALMTAVVWALVVYLAGDLAAVFFGPPGQP